MLNYRFGSGTRQPRIESNSRCAQVQVSQARARCTAVWTRGVAVLGGHDRGLRLPGLPPTSRTDRAVRSNGSLPLFADGTHDTACFCWRPLSRLVRPIDGYDPTTGIMRDKKALRGINPGFALDHMEPMRPVVDRGLLPLIDAETFMGADFSIQHDGVCRMKSRPCAAGGAACTGTLRTQQQVKTVCQLLTRARLFPWFPVPRTE